MMEPGERYSEGSNSNSKINKRSRNSNKSNKERNQTLSGSLSEGNLCKKKPEKLRTLHASNQQKIKQQIHAVTSENVTQTENSKKTQNNDNNKKVTKQIAMDCEMVGIGDGTKSMIARVSIVNRNGFCIYDKYVKPTEPIHDYRTKISGIRPHHVINGEDFKVVQQEVADILKGRILVGHALKYDLDVLYLSHPRKLLRDTSTFKTFRRLSKGMTPSLKKLAQELLGRDIQTGEHSSVEDARAAMQLYALYRNKWESELYSKSK